MGIRHPDELEDTLSPRQLAGWEAYLRVEPSTFDLVSAAVARLTWASLQPHTKKPLDESEYLLRFEPKPPPTPEEYRMKSMRAYLGHGGKVGAT